MSTNFELIKEVTLADGVEKCELIATEDTTVSERDIIRGKSQTANPCSYMGAIALESFIAELYVNYIRHSDGSNISESLSSTIENAIWAYDACIPFDEGIEYIQTVLKEHGYEEIRSVDILLLCTISYSGKRHSMAYYIGKAKELVEKYEWPAGYELCKIQDAFGRTCE